MSLVLSQEELIEQAFFFRSLRERLAMSLPIQDLLATVRDEVLSTTKMPMAIDFLLSELLHGGSFGPAMVRLQHYFTPFQTFIVRQAEDDRGRFDLRVGFELLERMADYLSQAPAPQGLFMYQFETLCRNRLKYDEGLACMANDPFYDEVWKSWILTVRRQIGLVELADLIYVRSGYYRLQQARKSGHTIENFDARSGTRAGEEVAGGETGGEEGHELLFDEKEGRIALANRNRDPLLLFASLQRHLGYPVVPRMKPADDVVNVTDQLARRVERMETRIKLLEEEQKGGIDITQFYEREEK